MGEYISVIDTPTHHDEHMLTSASVGLVHCPLSLNRIPVTDSSPLVLFILTIEIQLKLIKNVHMIYVKFDSVHISKRWWFSFILLRL